MAEKCSSIQDSSQVQSVCGSFDENLKLLEQRYHTSIICRSDTIQIQGSDAEIELAASVMTSILRMAAKGEPVTKQAVLYAADMVDNGSGQQLSEMEDDRMVCLTASGKMVKARTLGQQKYVQAIEKNTVVFGIGPAGTGKT